MFADSAERINTSVLVESDFYTRDYIASTHTILQALVTKAHILVNALYTAPDELFRRIEKLVSDIDEHVMILQKIFSPDSTGLIKIIARNDRREIYAQYTFLSIGNILRERLWLKLQTAILTSATLQVGESFSYIQKTLGCTQFQTLELASDFDYAKQALVFLPTDIGDIRNSETRKQANQFIFDIIKIVGGRTLCLFTSFAAMKETFVQIYSSMKEIGVELLTQ
jgi:Rad3-related DNA helicase